MRTYFIWKLLVSSTEKNWYHSQAQGWAGLHFMLEFFFLIFIYLAAVGFSCSMWDPQLQHVGSSSVTTDQTQSPAVGAWSFSHLTTKESPRLFKVHLKQEGATRKSALPGVARVVLSHLGLLLLLLSRFSRVQLCVTPQTAAHQAPLSLGFSRHIWDCLSLISSNSKASQT